MPSNSRHTPSQAAAIPHGATRSRGVARLHAVAAAVLLCAGLAQPDPAQAMALGRIVVQSALGEPLRAEIDVPEITAEEAGSLRVSVASGEAFRAAGMDFNPALANVQISLQKRSNGRSYLRVTSTRPVNEPFMDMILEANWASGRIVRDYTMLFDPPNLRAAAPAPLTPGVSQAPAPAVARPVAPATTPEAPRVIAPAPAAPVAPAKPVVAPRAAAPAPAPERAAAPVPAPAAPARSQQVRVRSGDTAGRIAAANLPANASLDQMLVAMLRANPSAFINGNVNLIKAGAVIDLPGATDTGSVSSGEARQIIAAQSRDFNEFRRRLAGAAPAASVAAADRQATGRVQAEIEDKKPAATTQDKLTLSKGATPGSTAKEDQIAKERQAQEASTRVAELSRNIEDLAKLGTSTTAAAPVAPSAPEQATPTTDAGLTVPAATAPASATATATAATDATASVAQEATPTTAPAAEPAATPVPAPAPAVEEPSLIEQLRDNPLVLPIAGGLLALLAGFGLYRMRQRKKGSGVDSSFLESRLQPDSFFGSSGGQRIDTNEAGASGSSMVYSPSQLDAAGDVDPVAEADVYLAYGRDLQAEEILKEAMRSTPTRVAIYNKLLEIYAKRRDAKAFEVVAIEAYALTQGQGPEWEHAAELGKELDPSNSLYQPGGAPVAKTGTAAGDQATVPFGSSTLAQQHTGPGSATDTGLDFDLDLDLGQPSGPAALAPVPTAEAAASPHTPASKDSDLADLSIPADLREDLNTLQSLTDASSSQMPMDPVSQSMDFDLDFPSEPASLPLTPATPAAPAEPEVAKEEAATFDDSEILPDFELQDPASEQASPAPAVAAAAAIASTSPELLSIDLSDINLDLEDKSTDANAGTDSNFLTEENPLDTKLSLAEEFRAIGDLEGARSLAEEVLAEASGALKAKATAFLADLG